MAYGPHELKTWPVYFDAVKRGAKTFEVRKNDRGFQTGDLVELQRLTLNRADADYDEDEPPLRFKIGWILQGGQFGIEVGYCVFSLEPIAPQP